MKTIITIEVEHKQPIPDLADKVAQRAYTLQGVDNARPMELAPVPIWTAATDSRPMASWGAA